MTYESCVGGPRYQRDPMSVRENRRDHLVVDEASVSRTKGRVRENTYLQES